MDRWSYNLSINLLGGSWIHHLSQVLGEKFKNVLFVTTPSCKKILHPDLSNKLGLESIDFLEEVRPNPDIIDIEKWIKKYSGSDYHCVIALGGGSCIDVGKILSFFLALPPGTSLKNYLDGLSVESGIKPLKFIAIPSTCGTGAEVTPFATIWDHSTGNKFSLQSNSILPSVAILDPSLVCTAPREVRVSSGLDAISHGLESIWNKNSTPLSLAYSEKSLRLSFKSFNQYVDNPNAINSAKDMQLASSFAGLAISSTKTSIAHSISYPLTYSLGFPHGLACGFTLPAIAEMAAEFDRELMSDLASCLGFLSIDAFIERLSKMLKEAGVPELLSSHTGGDIAKISSLTNSMLNPQRAANTLFECNESDVQRLITRALAIMGLRLD